MRLLIAMLTALAMSLPAKAADELTVKSSKHSVKETVDRLAAALKDKGIASRRLPGSTTRRQRRASGWSSSRPRSCCSAIRGWARR